jgi:phosphate starvation-inducible protein PhoH
LNAQVEMREISLEGADNARLANFAGPMEQNLRHVEERLGVEVRRRGHQLQVFGAPGSAQNAETVLRRMFELSRGRASCAALPVTWWCRRSAAAFAAAARTSACTSTTSASTT